MYSFAIEAHLTPDFAPRNEPQRYPGWWPGESFIVESHPEPTLYYLRPPKFGLSSTVSSPHFRAGHLELVSSVTGLRGPSLSRFLRDRGLESMDRRTPVIAAGSNAAPSQLAHKFRQLGISSAIPSLRVRLKGWGVGFVPELSRFGYAPATLFADPGLESNVFLQFLDLDQLAVMDESEGVISSKPGGTSNRDRTGNYNRVEIKSPIQVLHLTDEGNPLEGEVLQRAQAYISRSGVVSFGEHPVLFENDQFGREQHPKSPLIVNEAPEEYVRCSSQFELVTLLRDEDPAAAQEFLERLERKSQFRADSGDSGPFRAVRRDSELLSPSPNGVLPRPLTYAEIGQPTFHLREEGIGASTDDSPTGRGKVTRTVLASGNKIHRLGESSVLIGEDDFLQLGKPSRVVIFSPLIEGVVRSGPLKRLHAPRAIAKVVRDRDGLLAKGTIQMDEVLRVAVGASLGEAVGIIALEKMSFWARLGRLTAAALLGSPNYVTARAGVADVTTMERDVALVTPLTLQMLGIDPGDFVVLEGATVETNELRRATVRAFPLDELTEERREKRKSGGWFSAFPDAQTCLGLQMDLAPVFVDGALRERLFGPEHGQKVGVIRMRASRPQQIQKEFREFSLVVLFSLLAWILAAPEGDLSLASGNALAIVVVIALAGFLLLNRVRWRYRHTRRSRT